MHFPILFLLLAIVPATADAQSISDIVISPGVKISSSSGTEGGFTYGFELSITYYPSGLAYYGLVVDYDHASRGRRKIHLGAEVGTIFTGIEIGPTLVLGAYDPQAGLTLTPNVGGYVYPFYSITFLPDMVLHEGGAYIKFPMAADGGPLFSH